MYFVTDFCCFCLNEKVNLTNLNNTSFKNINIVNKVMLCVNSDFDTQNVPTFICLKCCIKLEAVYEFKKMCLGNFNRFHNYIRKLKNFNCHYKTKYVYSELKILISNLSTSEVKRKSRAKIKMARFKGAYFLTKFCCFCLNEGVNVIDLNDRQFKNRTILNKLMFCIIDDLVTQNLPIFICLKCCAKLEAAYEFKKLCLRNFNRFQNYVRKLKYVNQHCETKFVFCEPKILLSDLQTYKMQLDNRILLEDFCEILLVEDDRPQSPEKEVYINPSYWNIVSDNGVSNSENQFINQNQCSSCGKNLTSILRNYLTRPEKKSGTENLCSACDSILRLPYQKPFECKICGLRFTAKSSLRMHTLAHENKLPHVCNYCSKSFYKRYQLEKHLARCRMQTPKNKENADLYPCITCKKVFSGELNFRNHVLMHLKNVAPAPFVCPLCGRGFSKNPNLKRHIIRMHDKSRRPLYNCSICGIQLTSKHALQLHKELHGKLPYACSTCGKTFLSKGHLKLHAIKRRHNTLDSTIEEQEFDEINIDEHFLKVEIVEEEGPIESDQRANSVVEGLHEEESTTEHLSKQTLNCSENHPKRNENCTPAEVDYLVIVHDNLTTKPFTCFTCNGSFGTEDELQEHVKLHNKDKLCQNDQQETHTGDSSHGALTICPTQLEHSKNSHISKHHTNLNMNGKQSQESAIKSEPQDNDTETNESIFENDLLM